MQWLPNAEKTKKSSSSTRQSSAQVKWFSCTAATLTQKFENSPSKYAHLFGSLSPLVFKRLESFWPIYLLSVHDGPEILGGEDANGLSQGDIPGHSTNIHGEPHL